MPTDLGPRYIIRPPSEADVSAIIALMRACDIADTGQADTYETADLLDDWAGLALATDAWVVVAGDGTLAAYGTVMVHGPSRIFADGYVHPDHRGRGIGNALIDLTEARAAELVALAPAGSRQVLVNNAVVSVDAGRALLERRGYQFKRAYFRMDIALEAAPPAPVWPRGISVRPGDGSEADLRLAWETIEEGFRDHWGHEPRPYESWKRRKLRDTFDPSLWFFAEDGERTAAAALCRVVEPEQGWIGQIAVLRPWRQRGLALALLHHAFGEFYGRGITRIGLAVDGESLTGAQRLYERAGMHVTTRVGRFDKELCPGAELATTE
ncbi:MAG TPA: GNAT family N-acetyltransferase [Ktedonobacterales bacterium]|nr:GNAT family N-acetyltransferase [Ktedonobacterales bacterium]